MAEEDDDPESPPAVWGMRERMLAARPVVLAAAVVSVLAVLVFEVPMVSAAVGFVVVGGAALLAAAPGAELSRPSIGLPAVRRPVWPDTGMKLVIDALDEPCFVTDAQGVVRFQNRAAVERYGASRPGDPLSLKLRVPELLAAVDRARHGGGAEILRFSERVPTERAYLAVASPIRAPRQEGRGRDQADFVLLRLVDETERVRAERMRADFIANASHELRTPLASLTGFIETLLGPARNDEVNRERFLKIALEQAQRMARLIDDLLSLSRIEMKAHVRPEAEVDLAAILAHVVDAMAPLARSRGATVALDLGEGGSIVRGDRDELIQVFANLVENAVKYGREGGLVRVALGREGGPEQLAGIAVSVGDDGPGIAAEHLPRLTERFYRVDADHSRRQKGTGLGLAIVKHIVNRHRGRLSIRSAAGEGTTVTVWLEVVVVQNGAVGNS